MAQCSIVRCECVLNAANETMATSTSTTMTMINTHKKTELNGKGQYHISVMLKQSSPEWESERNGID